MLETQTLELTTAAVQKDTRSVMTTRLVKVANKHSTVGIQNECHTMNMNFIRDTSVLVYYDEATLQKEKQLVQTTYTLEVSHTLGCMKYTLAA